MLNTSGINIDTSKLYKPNNQLGLLSTAISKIGNTDHSFQKQIKQANTANTSPVRLRLFRESPEKKQKGLDGLVVGDPRKQTQVIYSSIHQSSSPMIHKPATGNKLQDSPSRAKQKMERFKNWDSKLDIELQLQNNNISRLNNEVSYQSVPQLSYVKTSTQFNDRINRNAPSIPQSDIVQLTAKLNAIPRTELTNFTRGHAHELSTLQQSLQRILKQSKAY